MAVKKAPSKQESDWAEEDVQTVAVRSKTVTLPEQARALKVTNNSEYLAAADFLKNIKSLRAEVDAAFDPIITKQHAAHKEALGQKKKAEQPLIDAENTVKQICLAYLQAQERLRLAEENRLRQENEDRIRKQAEEENFKRAKELSEKGDVEGAAAALDAPVDIPAVPIHVESTVPKVTGISSRTRYVVASVELMKLVKAVASGTAPIECLQANDKFLNSQATNFKRIGELYPGVVVKTEDGIAAGRD